MTPVAKPDNKRLASVLSPVSENGLPTEEETTKFINNAVHKAIASSIPTIVSQLRSELQTTISAAVAEAIVALKKDLLNEVNEKLVFAEQRSDLKTLCESEQLESYNRRDNLKICGLEEDTRTDETGRMIGEKPEQTITKVVEVANAIGATVDPVDISIAHRLSGRISPRAVEQIE